MVRLCKETQSTSMGEANIASFIDDSSNPFRAIQELTTKNKMNLSLYLNSLYNALRFMQKLLRMSAYIAADIEPRMHKFLPPGLTAFN